MLRTISHYTDLRFPLCCLVKKSILVRKDGECDSVPAVLGGAAVSTVAKHLLGTASKLPTIVY